MPAGMVMDMLTWEYYLSVLLPMLSLLTTMLLAYWMLLRQRYERRHQLVLDEIRLRETELRYASAVSTRGTHELIELVWKSVHTVNELEKDEAAQQSAALQHGLNKLREIQYREIEMLLANLDDDRGERELAPLRRLLDERRTELSDLTDSGRSDA